MAELYKLDFPNGKSYLGVTRKTGLARYEGHRYHAERGGKYPLYRAWRRLGAPKLTVLAKVEEHMLGETEIRAIQVFRTMLPNGYNVLPGGEFSPVHARLGKKHSKKARAKMSEAAKKRSASPAEREKMSERQKAFMSSAKGVRTRRKIAAVQRARMSGPGNPNKTPEGRARISQFWTGRSRPNQRGLNNVAHRPEVIAKRSGDNSPTKRPEVREKISKALKGNRNGAGNKGRTYSEETRAKIAKSLTGRWHSPETKLKQALSLRKFYQKRREAKQCSGFFYGGEGDEG